MNRELKTKTDVVETSNQNRWSSQLAISIPKLKALQPVHLEPINLVVCKVPNGDIHSWRGLGA